MSIKKSSRSGVSYTGLPIRKYKNASAGNTTILDVPGAPTIGTATAGGAEAIVTFTAPTLGGEVFSYTVTSSPGGITVTEPRSPIYIRPLVEGTAYTFTVAANNVNGLPGPSSAATNSVTPTAQTTYQVTASGTWTAPSSGTYEIHCVGGGGGGGGYYGGGGAGGFYSTSNLTLVGGTAYTVTVGGFGANHPGNAGAGVAGTGGSTSFVGPTTVTAAGGGGGVSRNFGTTAASANGGSGGGAPAAASSAWAGGGGGYDGSNGSKSLNAGYGGQAIGTGQLGVAIGLGTNPKIPGGGGGGWENPGSIGPWGTYGGTRSHLGGPYYGIYGYGVGHAGNFNGYNREGQAGYTATGKGNGGGGANWNDIGGNGAPGMIVIKKIS
jgi:hypothetical protein